MPQQTKHNRLSRSLLLIEKAGLIIIAVATIIAVGHEIANMVHLRTVRLADLLLLFIYLEVLTMVGIYLQSGQLPVRMPMYIAMVALARYLILDMKEMDWRQILAVSAAALILAAAVLVVRYGHVRYPYEKDDEAGQAARREEGE
ncbi:MAG: phosphate-starvation-inducible PsiE family protein [Gammaproteobacteria bacterium]